MKCPVCGSPGDLFKIRGYLQCLKCERVFLRVVEKRTIIEPKVFPLKHLRPFDEFIEKLVEVTPYVTIKGPERETGQETEKEGA
jgi:hypothetical protein